MEPLCNVFYGNHEVVFQYFDQPSIQYRMDAMKFKRFLEKEGRLEPRRCE
jgi:hypothetical protein